MTTIKAIGLVIAGVIVSVIISSVVAPKSGLGGVYNQVQQYFDSGIRVGPQGTNVTKLIATTCNLIGTDGSQAASSTSAYDCAVTGVVSTDAVHAQIATTTTSRGNGMNWVISAAKASTTAGYVTVLLTNNGTAATPSQFGVGSSTAILVFKSS